MCNGSGDADDERSGCGNNGYITGSDSMGNGNGALVVVILAAIVAVMATMKMMVAALVTMRVIVTAIGW